MSIYTNTTVGQDSATVMCPASHPYAISGGGQVFNQGTDEQEPLSDSTPYNSGTGYPSGWTVKDANASAANITNLEDVATAICAR